MLLQIKMTRVGLTKLLVECGALPPSPMSAEEARKRRNELQKAALQRRMDLIRAARENCEQAPVFPTGRPRMYTTPEEAKARVRSQRLV